MTKRNCLIIVSVALLMTACGNKSEIIEETSSVIETQPVVTEAVTETAVIETVATEETETSVEESTEAQFFDEEKIREINERVENLDTNLPDNLGEAKISTADNISFVTNENVTIDDQEIEQYVQYVLNMNRAPAADGATVNFGDEVILQMASELTGGVDGLSLVVGDGVYTRAFDEALIGARVGDERSVEVNFPNDYVMPDLAGKSTLFVMTVKGINVVPEFTDQFVYNLGSGVETVEEFKEQAKERLKKIKVNGAPAKYGYLDELYHNSEINVYSKALEAATNARIKAEHESLKILGSSMGEYLGQSNTEFSSYYEQLLPETEESLSKKIFVDTYVKENEVMITDDTENKFASEVLGTTKETAREMFPDEESYKDALNEYAAAVHFTDNNR